MKILKLTNDYICLKCSLPYVGEIEGDSVRYYHLPDTITNCEDINMYFLVKLESLVVEVKEGPSGQQVTYEELEKAYAAAQKGEHGQTCVAVYCPTCKYTYVLIKGEDCVLCQHLKETFATAGA